MTSQSPAPDKTGALTAASAPVREVLERASVMAVSTINPDGSTWIAPVGYQADEDLTLHFASEMTARHVQNLLTDSRVSVAIYDTDTKESAVGLQIAGHASLKSDGGAGWQQFEITVDEVWLHDSRIDKQRHRVETTPRS